MDTKTLCLAVLTQDDASGYEIKKAFDNGAFAHIKEIGFGSIYPALAALLEAGLVSVTKYAQDGRPDKKVYSLTSAGRLALLDALDAPTEHDKVRSDFLFRMMFSTLLAPSVLEEMIEERLTYLHATIKQLEASTNADSGNVGETFVQGYALTLYKAMAAYTEEHKYELLGASLMSERAVAE